MAMLASLKKWCSAPWLPSQYGKAPYFWMLSLAMFGWKYFNIPFYAIEIVFLGLSLPLFLLLYLGSFWVGGGRLIFCIASVTAMGLGWAPVNYGSAGLIIFAATMCARFSETRHSYSALALVIGAVALSSYVLQLDTFFWMPAILLGIPGGMAAIFNEAQARSNQQLRSNQEQIKYLAALAERERIGRDLHDLLGHTLSVITLKAELAGKLFERDPAACKKEISDIELTARQALGEVRAAVLGCRATGLAQELRNAHDTLAAAQVSFVSDIGPEAIPPVLENVIALALREAVTNIIRHAQASRCEMSLHTRDQQVLCSIADNGASAKLAPGVLLRNGHGLRGMSERVRALGGSFAVSTAHGMGIEITLPLAGAGPEPEPETGTETETGTGTLA